MSFPVLYCLPEFAKLMSIESVMPSNHLILCHLLILLPSIFSSIRVFSSESVLHVRWPKYWNFNLSISPSNEYSGLISFTIDCWHLVFINALWFFLLNMTNLDRILKIRDITLRTKVCLVKAMVFPVVMYECESWTIKKAEHQRFDAFELWCWRRLLKVPWMQGNQTSQS